MVVPDDQQEFMDEMYKLIEAWIMDTGQSSEPLDLPKCNPFQVWPLTHFFLFPFCEHSLICLEGKSMTPHRGNAILFRSSQQLPRLRLGPSKGFLS